MPPQTTMTMLPSPSPSETEFQTQINDSTHLLTAPGIALSCGAEHDADPATDDWWDARRPAVVPFLPWPSEQPQDRTEPRRPPRRSTGCGARVHPRAQAARDGGHWVGYVDGMERTVVIKLDGQYFRKRSALGLGGAGCGCVADGVGCGNALGALHIPCRVHRTHKGPAHYVFLPSAVSPSIKDAAESSHPTASTSPTSTVNSLSTESIQSVANADSMNIAATPLTPAPPSATDLFSADFIQNVANGLDDFELGMFRGDGDINFERDFGRWFNPDDVTGMQLGAPLNENTITSSHLLLLERERIPKRDHPYTAEGAPTSAVGPEVRRVPYGESRRGWGHLREEVTDSIFRSRQIHAVRSPSANVGSRAQTLRRKVEEGERPLKCNAYHCSGALDHKWEVKGPKRYVRPTSRHIKCTTIGGLIGPKAKFRAPMARFRSKKGAARRNVGPGSRIRKTQDRFAQGVEAGISGRRGEFCRRVEDGFTVSRPHLPLVLTTIKRASLTGGRNISESLSGDAEGDTEGTNVDDGRAERCNALPTSKMALLPLAGLRDYLVWDSDQSCAVLAVGNARTAVRSLPQTCPQNILLA
ncbi:hypothetical protein B0H11DRAFT_2201077 [Mycena galericulata]|nr:hypothetical protein B0H11DRAFT_2201077 [Mycena galericulata]